MNLIDEYKLKMLNTPNGNIYLIFNILHYISLIYVLTYPFMFKNRNGDYIYLGFILLISIQWLFLKNEYIVNYLEKKKNNPNYNLGDNADAPEFAYMMSYIGCDYYGIKTNKNKIIYKILKSLATNIAIYLLFLYVAYRSIKKTNNKLYLFLILLLLIILIIISIKSYYDKRKLFLCNLDFPIWLKSAKLRNIIKKKTCSKITLLDIYQDLGVSIFNKYKFLPSWEQWELHINKILPIIEKEKPDFIVGILSGGGIIATYLSYKTGIPHIIIKASKYSNKSIFKIRKEIMNNNSYVKIINNINLTHIKNKKVLLVDDFINTGYTMKRVYDYINKYNPSQIITIISSKSRHKSQTIIKIDYTLPRAYQNILPYGFDA